MANEKKNPDDYDPRICFCGNRISQQALDSGAATPGVCTYHAEQLDKD